MITAAPRGTEQGGEKSATSLVRAAIGARRSKASLGSVTVQAEEVIKRRRNLQVPQPRGDPSGRGGGTTHWATPHLRPTPPLPLGTARGQCSALPLHPAGKGSGCRTKGADSPGPGWRGAEAGLNASTRRTCSVSALR